MYGHFVVIPGIMKSADGITVSPAACCPCYINSPSHGEADYTYDQSTVTNTESNDTEKMQQIPSAHEKIGVAVCTNVLASYCIYMHVQYT